MSGQHGTFAGGCVRAWLVLAGVSLLGIVIDLGTKSWAFASIAGRAVEIRREDVLGATSLSSLIPAHEPVVVVPHVLELTLVLNNGAVFGLGSGARWFFVVFTMGAIAFVLWAFATQTARRDHVAHVSAGLLIAGGVGNLYDRLVFACVRDFLHPLPTAVLPFSGGRPLWPYVSNVADAFLLVGIAGLLLFSVVKKDGSKVDHPRDDAGAKGGDGPTGGLGPREPGT